MKIALKHIVYPDNGKSSLFYQLSIGQATNLHRNAAKQNASKKITILIENEINNHQVYMSLFFIWSKLIFW